MKHIQNISLFLKYLNLYFKFIHLLMVLRVSSSIYDTKKRKKKNKGNFIVIIDILRNCIKKNADKINSKNYIITSIIVNLLLVQ